LKVVEGQNDASTYAILVKYCQMGFKPVPIGRDSKTPAVSSTNEIYNNPSQLMKYRGLTGKDIQTLPIEEQKNIISRDIEYLRQQSKENIKRAAQKLL
jgi:hypothetical protein